MLLRFLSPLFLVLSIACQAQDTLVMRVLTVSGEVTVDEHPVKAGEKILSSSQVLNVRRKSSVGILTERGNAYELKAGNYRVHEIDEKIERIKSWKNVGAVHRNASHKLFLSGNMRTANNSGIYGDSLYLGWIQMDEWREKDPTIPRTPITISITNIFYDSVKTWSVDHNFSILRISGLWNHDIAFLLRADNDSLTSDEYLLKQVQPEQAQQLSNDLAAIDESDLVTQLIIKAALFEVSGHPYDQIWMLYKLSQLERKGFSITHPYYRKQLEQCNLHFWTPSIPGD